MLTPSKPMADKIDSESRIGISWSSRSRSSKSTERTKLRRPVISAPCGPVKNSRGPDFTRSETLIVVGSIDDCGCCDHDAGPMATRRISAGFKRGVVPLMAKPTVARSAVMATNTVQALPKTEPVKQLRKQSLSASASRTTLGHTLKTSSTASMLPRLGAANQDENVPPPSHDHAQPPSQPRSKLPKSRTMNVLYDLKASISRPSLTARSFNSTSLSRQTPASSSSSSTLIPPSSSTITLPSSNKGIPSSASKLRLPRQSLVSLARSSRSSTPESSPFHISAAQPSAYWSGRFVSLHDRLLSESIALEEGPLPPPKVPGMTSTTYIDTPSTTQAGLWHYRPTKLSHSITTSALTSVTSTTTSDFTMPPSCRREKDPDSRCRRVFLQLDALCSTSEAKRSLREWQQAYARRHNRPAMLPEDGSMQDRSLMARFFGSGVSKDERRRLTSLRSVTSGLGGKKAPTGEKRRTLH